MTKNTITNFVSEIASSQNITMEEAYEQYDNIPTYETTEYNEFGEPDWM